MEKIDWKIDGKYQTKNGRKVNYLGKSSNRKFPQVVVEICTLDSFNEDTWEVWNIGEDGSYWSTGSDEINDVIEVPPEPKVYVYVLSYSYDYEGSTLVGVFSNPEDAQAAALICEYGDHVAVEKMEMNKLGDGDIAFSKKQGSPNR